MEPQWGLRACAWLWLLLVRRWNHKQAHWITQFHHIIYQHFDKVAARLAKLYVLEKRHSGGVHSGILHLKFDLALTQHGGLIRCYQTNALGKLANASRPAVKNAQLESSDRHLGNAQKIKDANEDEIAIGFLADFFANQGALEVRENSGWLHKVVLEYFFAPRNVIPARGLDSFGRELFGRSNSILHQQGDRHRSNSTRIGGNPSCDGLNRGEVNIADEF